MNEDIKAELQKYIADVKTLNSQLQELDKQKGNILQVGTRIEGVIAYLRSKLSPAELAEIDGVAPAAPAVEDKETAAA